MDGGKWITTTNFSNLGKRCGDDQQVFFKRRRLGWDGGTVGRKEKGVGDSELALGRWSGGETLNSL